MAGLSNTGINGFIASAKFTGKKILKKGKEIPEMVEHFLSGFAGYGWKIWEYVKGKWMLEIDSLRVRGTMTVFELLISKIRAIIGALSISQGQGKIKTVALSDDASEYLITVEEAMSFKEGDFIKCQTWTGKAKMYHVKISSITDNKTLHIPLDEFDWTHDEDGGIVVNNAPEVGDEIIQFGNDLDETRQSAIYIHADEGGQPAIDVMFGINSKDWTNCVKVRIGGDIPGTDGLKGFFVENGMIKGTDSTGHVTYCLYPDGTAEFADKAAMFKPDKSGYIAGGAINWHYDEVLQKYRCNLNDVVLNWNNLSADVQREIKPYIGSNGNWWIGDTDTGEKARGTDGTNGKDGEPGKDGTDGEQGKEGMIILKSEWSLNTPYRNDESLTTAPRYLSVAMVKDVTVASGWRAYRCKKTHTSAAENAPPNAEFWEEFPLNVAAIFTSLIIADDAVISNGTIGGFEIRDGYLQSIKKDEQGNPAIRLNGVLGLGDFVGKIKALEGAKIGDWNIVAGGLEALAGSGAKIRLVENGGKFIEINTEHSGTILAIRNDNGRCLRLYTHGVQGKALEISAQTGGTAISSAGSALLYQRSGEKWSAPGMLAAATFEMSSTGGSFIRRQHWAVEGVSLTASYNSSTHDITITHGLNHPDWVLLGDSNSDNGAVIPGTKTLNGMVFNVRNTNPGHSLSFQLIGRNKYVEI